MAMKTREPTRTGRGPLYEEKNIYKFKDISGKNSSISQGTLSEELFLQQNGFNSLLSFLTRNRKKTPQPQK